MRSKYKLKIKGKSVKRFVENIINSKIFLYDIEYINKNEINIIVDDIGYLKILKIKTSYSIDVVRTYGLIRYKKLFNKYFVFIISLIIGAILIKLLSCVIFSIKIEHSKEEIRELIKNDLADFGIKKFHFKVSYDKKEKIKRKILQRERNRIEWLEIDSIGTKYIVKVEERIKNKKNKKEKPQNIIAKKNGMILDIDASHGEVVKKKFDYVKKGDVIISGIIKNKDKPMKKVRADGSVYAEVWYKVSVDVAKKYNSYKKTGRNSKRLEFKILNKSIYLFGNNYMNYKTIRKPIISNKLLPVSLNYTYLEEVIVNKYNYDITNIDKHAIDLGEKKLKNKLDRKDRIIYKKVLKKTLKDSRIIVDMFFKVKEDIKETESIEKIDLKEYEVGDKDESGN